VSIIDKIDSHRIEDYSTLSKVIQFKECIGFLEKIGRVIYGNQFKIRPGDYKIIFQLLVYFYCDLENAAHLGINLKKGILLSGPVGCGKTSLMFLMRHFLAKDAQYTVVATRDICLEFLQDGFQVLEKSTSKSFIAGQEISKTKSYKCAYTGVKEITMSLSSDIYKEWKPRLPFLHDMSVGLWLTLFT